MEVELVLDRISQRGVITFILFFSLLPFHSMAGETPRSPVGGGTLDLRGGKQGYYYTEDRDDCFDNEFLKNGMTIEFWFCLARCTERGEWWNLVAKPSLYQIRIEHYYSIWIIQPQNLKIEDEGVWLRRVTQGGSSARTIWEIVPGKDYEPMWHHVVLQGRAAGNSFSGIVFIDGVSTGPFRSSSSSFISDNDRSLYVGGLPSEFWAFVRNGENHIRSNVTTFDGLIDELRISNVERYEQKGPGGNIRIKERFQPDEHTVALWHFDEGPGALRYEDASGNGHTLFAAGQLEVIQKRKTPILWGAIKEQKK
jgi:hypothetical protein